MSGRRGRKPAPLTLTTSRQYKKKSQKRGQTPRREPTVEITEEDAGISTAVDHRTCPSTRAIGHRHNIGRELSQGVVRQMKAFAARTVSLGIPGLCEEFTRLRSFMPFLPRTAFDQNPLKNRYMDVTCVDQTRVVLHYGRSPAVGDYIHANYVTALMPQTKFICAQGPLESTISDFWRMVWQEKAKHILMLCRIMENGKPKCAHYWPTNDASTMTIGSLTITRGQTDTTGDSAFYTTWLTVTEANSKDELRVKLYHWINWPDRGVPDSSLAPLRLLRKVRDDRGATAIVHCSAGIGRTGTVVGIELCLRQLLDGKSLNVADMIVSLRQQRMHCVQTEVQYLYIHRVLLEYVKLKGVVTRQEIQPFADAYDAFVHAL